MKFKQRLKNKLELKGTNKLISGKNTIVKYNEIKLKGKNNCIHISDNSILKKCIIEIVGENNNITISSNVKVAKSKIQIITNNSEIQFDKNTNIQDTLINQFSAEGKISIGENTTFTAVNIVSEEKGNKITIGKNCMFSYGINIRNTDSHPIYDIENRLINKGKSIVIKDNVWIGMGVTILKGIVIEDGCIVGAKSLVSGNVDKKNSIAIGVPAKIIRENIRWERKFKQ